MPRGRGRGGGRRGRTRVGRELADEVDDATPKVRRRRGRGDDDDSDGNGNDSQDGKTDSDSPEYAPGEKLPPKARAEMRGLESLQDSSCRDAILARGGNASAFRRIDSSYLDKPVGELAKLAAGGDAKAKTALKLIQQAGKKAQKYKRRDG